MVSVCSSYDSTWYASAVMTFALHSTIYRVDGIAASLEPSCSTPNTATGALHESFFCTQQKSPSNQPSSFSMPSSQFPLSTSGLELYDTSLLDEKQTIPSRLTSVERVLWLLSFCVKLLLSYQPSLSFQIRSASFFI